MFSTNEPHSHELKLLALQGTLQRFAEMNPLGRSVWFQANLPITLFGITRRVETWRYFLFGLRERRDQIWSCLALVWHFPWIKKSCKMCFTYVHKVGIPLLAKFRFYFCITSFERASCEFMYLDKWLWVQSWTLLEQMCLSTDFYSSIFTDFYTL